MILNHISIGVSDVNAAVKFYDDVLATLAVDRVHFIEGAAAAYGEKFEFWIGCPCSGSASTGNGSHVAFNAQSHVEVDEFYRVALESGGQCAGKPGLRPEYADNYYAAFILDLDGNKIEAVSM
ncbi:VOC family protein [Vibrio sp. T187]|uniref:VOC family protein n=1 Tax=Vibrio TaxID=662 RepID=UPI0010C94351|nr:MULTISPECIES: VOC family protein [Vibrio]MBW3695183.1 VOC family protein [Vibrio sp. T187]